MNSSVADFVKQKISTSVKKISQTCVTQWVQDTVKIIWREPGPQVFNKVFASLHACEKWQMFINLIGKMFD